MAAKGKLSRYSTPKGPEAEFQPGSRRQVLRNSLAITSKTEMDNAEYQALARAQERYVKTTTPKTRFTAALVRRMHRDWLGPIYPWAGQYRRVELQKGSFRWPPAHLVDQNMTAFERDLLARRTPCRPGELTEVARKIAEVHAELLLIHPFRDGNGRLARWLAELMCLQAGFPIPDYGFTGKGSRKQQDAYLRAVTRGYTQDYTALTHFFTEAIRRRLAGTVQRIRTFSPRAPSK
jgi:cell filamentation protein